MSQETTCDLTSSSSSIPLVTEPVSPRQVINADVPNIYPRWQKRRQKKRLGVKKWAASGGSSPCLVASSDIKRHLVVAARWPSSNAADQDESETLYVSLSAEASSLGGGTSASPLSLREVGSSSGPSEEPLSTSPLSNEEQTASGDFETTVLLTFASNTSDSTVSTPGSVSDTASNTSVNLSTSSSSSPAGSSISLDTLTSTSTVQPSITSPPPLIPSDSPESSSPPSASPSLTSSGPPQSSSSSTWSASAMATSDVFSRRFPSSTRSSTSRSASETLRTTFMLPDPSPSSEPAEDSSSFSSWINDPETSYVPLSSTLSPSSDVPSFTQTPSQSDDTSSQPSLTSFPPSETLTTPTRTFTITKVFTTTFSDGRTTTVSKVVETGVLRTDTPQFHSNLSHTTGAIAGIAVSVVIAAILFAVLVFFGCKRYRSRRDARMGSIDTFLSRAREIWRPPLDGDDDEDGSYMRGYGATNPLTRRQTVGSQSHSGEGDDGYAGGKGPGSSGDHLSGDGGHGSAEAGNMHGVNALSPSSGGQPYMSDFAQDFERAFPRPEPAVVPVYSSEDMPPEDSNQYWWGINDPQSLEDGDVAHPGGRSAASLTVFGGSSSGGHGTGMEPVAKPNVAKRASLSGPRPMPPDKRRNRSSPPSSFALGTNPISDSAFDCERQTSDQGIEKNTMVGLLNRLRRSSTRRMSSQSVATLKESQELVVPAFPSNLYSPSLLNPPTPIPPQTTQGVVPFPRNGYADPPLPSVAPEMSNYTSRAASFPWPPITLPPPSPVLTDNSSLLAEGLLHPRLSALAAAGQASTASLRDHEDYTRPINGLVNNHLRSTTTFDTLDSDDGIVMAS